MIIHSEIIQQYDFDKYRKYTYLNLLDKIYVVNWVIVIIKYCKYNSK